MLYPRKLPGHKLFEKTAYFFYNDPRLEEIYIKHSHIHSGLDGQTAVAPSMTKQNYWKYYADVSPSRAAKNFAPFMEEWDYDLTKSWLHRTSSELNRLFYECKK